MTTPDRWESLRAYTGARIAQGRSGASLPTSELLKFELDHARARDAVLQPFDPDRLAQETQKSTGLKTIVVSTLAKNRETYLRRPDLGRSVDEESLRRLKALVKASTSQADGGTGVSPVIGHQPDKPETQQFDVGLVLSDGLSAQAADHHAAELAGLLVEGLKKSGLSIAPIVVVPFGRVACQDLIGQALGVKLSVILIGERPGLLSPDSLGGYLVYNPAPGKTDADRNCVSNIRPQGLPLQAAAQTILHLTQNALIKKLTGVNLKDDRLLAPANPATALPGQIE